jgi:dynein heavy chain, axonemal
MEFLDSFENSNSPELFGLHPNAAISSATFECDFIMNSILAVRSSSSKGGGNSSDSNQMIFALAHQLLDTLPKDFDISLVSTKYSLNYYESMNTVLIQEVLRYNTLLNIIRNSLKDLILALQGFKVMIANLDNLAESIKNNVIPRMWAEKSYPSLKPLLSYHKDLLERTSMF